MGRIRDYQSVVTFKRGIVVTPLTIAVHPQQSQYWGGGHYALNLSFDSLRDKQWTLVLQTLWSHSSVQGPLAVRYIPNVPVTAVIAVQPLPPTATMTQHGRLAIEGLIVGCDVQATRSLFECISVLVPVSMFANMPGTSDVRRDHPELQALDTVFYELALAIYDVAPFKIAAIGYERECQLPAELRTDAQMRHDFLVQGNFLAQEDVLRNIEPDLTPYQEVRPGLYWLGPRS